MFVKLIVSYQVQNIENQEKTERKRLAGSRMIEKGVIEEGSVQRVEFLHSWTESKRTQSQHQHVPEVGRSEHVT